MLDSTRSAPNVLLLLCSTTAILMTFAGLIVLISTHLIVAFAQFERFKGESDAISVALIFGGIAVALKTIEVGVRTRSNSFTD